MRLPEIEWAAVVEVAASVHAHCPTLLPAFADMPVQPQFARKFACGHEDWLVEQGVLGEVGPGGRLSHTDASRGLRVLLRAARDCEVLDASGARATTAALKDYLARNFTAVQRGVVLDGRAPRDERARRALIARLTSVHWSREFLGVEAPLEFDKPRARRVYGESMDSAVHLLTCLLLRRAAEAPLEIPHDILLDCDSVVARALGTAIRYFLLFPRLKDGVLTMGLLPDVAEDVRIAGAEPPEVIPATLPEPRAFVVQDAESVFVHACTHPLRVKSTGRELYQRDLDDLIAGLAVAPTRFDPEHRVVSAVNTLMRIGALEHATTVSSRRCLTPTQAGHDWMAASPALRFESFLDDVRTKSVGDRLHRLGLTDLFYYLDAATAHAVWDGLVSLYQGLPKDGVVSLSAYVAYHARRLDPFAGRDAGRDWGFVAGSDGDWEHVQVTFIDWLGSLGGLAFARDGDGEDVLVCACELGDYILGLRDEPPVPEASEARVIVQANFDIVFLGPSPAAEAALARFSDRGDHGHVGTLFRITRASIMRAGAAGVTFDDIQRALAQHADGVPANVQHEISTWLERVRRVRATSGIVVECEDTDTADRIESESRRGAFTRISPTALLATDRAAFDRAARTLASRGIVFDLDLSADIKPKKKPARRRRRW